MFAQNHSCAPNCWMKNVVINEHTKRKCILALFTLEPVEENQELHFSYFGSLDGVCIYIKIGSQRMFDHLITSRPQELRSARTL